MSNKTDAKRVLSFYFSLAIGNLDRDQQSEINCIVDDIVTAAVNEVSEKYEQSIASLERRVDYLENGEHRNY